MANLKITLSRSLIGYEKSQRLTANALGLGKVGSTVLQADSPSIRGMIHKLAHALSVEAEDGTTTLPSPRDHRKPFHGPQHGPLGVRRK